MTPTYRYLLLSLLYEAHTAIQWHKTGGMKVATTPAMGPGVALRILNFCKDHVESLEGHNFESVMADWAMEEGKDPSQDEVNRKALALIQNMTPEQLWELAAIREAEVLSTLGLIPPPPKDLAYQVILPQPPTPAHQGVTHGS